MKGELGDVNIVASKTFRHVGAWLPGTETRRRRGGGVCVPVAARDVKICPNSKTREPEDPLNPPEETEKRWR